MFFVGRRRHPVPAPAPDPDPDPTPARVPDPDPTPTPAPLGSKVAYFATLSRWDPGCAPVHFLFEKEAQAQCSSERANVYCRAHTTLYASM